MPVLNIRNLGQAGVVTDIAPWDLPPNVLSGGINFRLSAGKVQSAGGIASESGGSGDILGHITQSTDFNLNSTWIVAGSNNIKSFDGTNFSDLAVTFREANPRFTGLDPKKWSSCSIGEVLFLNHPDLYPVYWTDVAGQGANIKKLDWHINTETWEQKSISCNVMASHKNFLWGLGMNRGNEVYHDEVCWSHPAEPNGIPFSWRPTLEQADSIAGSVSLGRGGSIIGGESLRDSMVVYSEEAISSFDFTGDALGWRRRSISTAAGLVSKEGVVEVDGVHYFIGPEDILAFDGNRVTSILHNKLRRRFAANLSGEHIENSWAAHNKTFNEIWFGVPENGATNPNVAYVFNYRDGTFAIRDLERQINHAHFGDEPASVDIPWSSMAETWDNERGAWTMGGSRPFEKVLFGVTDSVWDIDPSFGTVSSATEQTTPTIVTRTDLPIGGHEANTTITRVYPLVDGTSELEFRFGSQQKAGGPVRWVGNWRKFNPGVDRKIDVRTTGECHAFEVRSTGGFFNLTGLDIEFQPAGGR